MQRNLWSKLNKQQVGTYAEYFVKMELTMYGFQVYGTEVDDRGIDFVTRYERGPFLQVQVKSVRNLGYVYMTKDKFELSEQVYLALALLVEGVEPDLFLVPSTVWRNENALFVGHDYEGLESEPEWGLNLSQKNLSLLEPYRFVSTVEKLVAAATGGTDHP
jgi:hypothetical protein